MTEACARIVERDDPHLFAAALFAPEPARSRLMVLYAFDCELSRATRSSKESMIPRMRLQWWRDVIEEAKAGGAPKAHDVAGPLAGLVNGGPLAISGDLPDLIDAHEKILNLPWAADDWATWRAFRFQSLVASACQILRESYDPAPRIGGVLAHAFSLRNAMRMAGAQVVVPFVGLEGSDVAQLARGSLTDQARSVIMDLADVGLNDLHEARRIGVPDPRRVMPVLLPLLWAERALRLACRSPEVIFGGLDDIDRPFDGLRLAWRAATGRW